MAIALDTLTALVNDVSADSSETLSHDGGSGSDRVTTCHLYTVDLNVVATVNYNGVPMVQQEIIDRGVSGNRFLRIYTKFGTSTGVNNMVASFSPNSRSTMGAATVSGAAQSDTLDGSGTKVQATGTNMNFDPAPTVPGCIVLVTSVTTSNSNPVTPVSNVVNLSNGDITNILRSDPVPIASAGSYVMSYNYISGAAAVAWAVIAPAGGGVVANLSARRQHLMMM